MENVIWINTICQNHMAFTDFSWGNPKKGYWQTVQTRSDTALSGIWSGSTLYSNGFAIFL